MEENGLAITTDWKNKGGCSMYGTTLNDRLRYRAEEDFKRLLHQYLNDDSNDFNRRIKSFFDEVRSEHFAQVNHPEEVLAFSVGGSTTKLMLGKIENGQLYVSHMVVKKNPTEYTHFYDYLDGLFIKDPVVYRYLTQAKEPTLCVTLPVMIGDDDIPFHPVKIRYITHMLARNDSEMTEELNLKNNLNGYFESRNLRMPVLYYQSDPVIAHIGGLFMMESVPRDSRTMLLVCGTGMATADDNYQRVISRLRMMDFDEELYPEDFTEGYVYETACSGKGLFDIMARAIRIKAKEADSSLAAYLDVLAPFFTDLYDSVTVAKLWKSAVDPDFTEETVEKIRSCVSGSAMAELQEIAGMIMDRVAGSLAHAILVSAVKIDRDFGESPYSVIFEGSIALDPYINPCVLKHLEARMQNVDLFEEAGGKVPSINTTPPVYKEVFYAESVPSTLREKMDITLIGTAVAAEGNRRRR